MSRAFGGRFADPESADLRFARSHEAASDAWHERLGEPIFTPLHEDDRHVLGKLHIPIGDSHAAFDEQILHLAKLVVDYLNESALTAAIGRGLKTGRAWRSCSAFLSSKEWPTRGPCYGHSRTSKGCVAGVLHIAGDQALTSREQAAM